MNDLTPARPGKPFRQQIAEKNAEIARLRGELAAKDDEIARLKDQVTKLKAKLEDAERSYHPILPWKGPYKDPGGF